MIPLGPRQTCSISAGPGRQVATTSHSLAKAAAELDQIAPARSSDCAASGRRSWLYRPRMKLGFIGVGNIGAPIASQLLGAGHSLVVHIQLLTDRPERVVIRVVP